MTLHIATHRLLMIKILKDIFSETTVGPFLGFKGGTAVYLFYGLPRFSVDLDFDLLDIEKKEYIFEKVKSILEHYGVIKEGDKKHGGLFFNLSYTDKKTDAQNVKIDVNSKNFGSRYEIKEYIGISMNVMIQEDIAAHKLVAMYERGETVNRDIFDVWFFLKNNWPINKKIIEERTKLSYTELLSALLVSVEAMDGRNMLSGLGELIETVKEKDWVRNKLRTEVTFFLKLALDGEK